MTTQEIHWAQQIADRINRYGIGRWLAALAENLDVSFSALAPECPSAKYTFTAPRKGLQIVLTHPHADHVDIGDPERWQLTAAKFYLLKGEFGVWNNTLPFDLNSESETPNSAKNKLSNDTSGFAFQTIARGDRRISYFLDDARVVELTFRFGMVGLECVHVVRLGSAQFYDEADNS